MGPLPTLTCTVYMPWEVLTQLLALHNLSWQLELVGGLELVRLMRAVLLITALSVGPLSKVSKAE